MSEVSLKKARQFYWIVSVALSVYAALAWHHGHMMRSQILVGAAVLLLAIHYILPAFSMIIFQANHWLLSTVGGLATKLFLIVFFYAIFTPYGLLIRLFQRDPLERKYEPQRPSYWIRRKDIGVQDKACENPY